MRSLILFLFFAVLVTGCGDEPKATDPVPPVGDKFEKGKDSKDKKDKQPNPKFSRSSISLLGNC